MAGSLLAGSVLQTAGWASEGTPATSAARVPTVLAGTVLTVSAATVLTPALAAAWAVAGMPSSAAPWSPQAVEGVVAAAWNRVLAAAVRPVRRHRRPEPAGAVSAESTWPGTTVAAVGVGTACPVPSGCAPDPCRRQAKQASPREAQPRARMVSARTAGVGVAAEQRIPSVTPHPSLMVVGAPPILRPVRRLEQPAVMRPEAGTAAAVGPPS